MQKPVEDKPTGVSFIRRVGTKKNSRAHQKKADPSKS